MSSDSESNDDLLRFSDLEENSDGAGEEDVGIGGGRPSLGLDRGEDEEDQGEESKGQKGLRHLKEISSVLGEKRCCTHAPFFHRKVGMRVEYLVLSVQNKPSF